MRHGTCERLFAMVAIAAIALASAYLAVRCTDLLGGVFGTPARTAESLRAPTREGPAVVSEAGLAQRLQEAGTSFKRVTSPTLRASLEIPDCLTVTRDSGHQLAAHVLTHLGNVNRSGLPSLLAGREKEPIDTQRFYESGDTRVYGTEIAGLTIVSVDAGEVLHTMGLRAESHFVNWRIGEGDWLCMRFQQWPAESEYAPEILARIVRSFQQLDGETEDPGEPSGEGQLEPSTAE